MQAGKKILLGITGSIAAYKIPLLVRMLKKQGAEVRVVMTPSAKDFVTPLTLSTLSGSPVLSNGFDALIFLLSHLLQPILLRRWLTA